MAVGEGRGLADVVEEGRQPHDRSVRRDRVDRAHGVIPEVLALDLVLRDAALGGEVRRDRRKEPGVGEQAEPDRRNRRAQQLVQLGRDPLPRQVPDQLGPCPDPGQRPRLHREPERRRQPDGSDHPERVLLEAGARVADRAEHAGNHVGETVVRVHERRRLAWSRAPGHGVDREVAARQVEFDGVAELDAVRSPEVGVVVVGPEGRDLEDLAVTPDGDGPEPVLVDGAREEIDEPFGQRVRGEIPVHGPPPEDDVAQRPADDIRGLTGRPECLEQGADGGRDRALDGVGPADRGRQLRPRNR